MVEDAVADYACVRDDRAVQITNHLAGGQQPSTCTEWSLRVGINGFRRVWLFTDRLNETDAPVCLQGSLGQVIPSFVYYWLILIAIQISVVHAPKQSVGEEGCSGSLRTRCVVLAKHRTAPIPVGTLHTCHSLCQFLESLHEDTPVGIILWHICQHLGKTGQNPSVAACPKALAFVASRLDFWINVFRVAII